MFNRYWREYPWYFQLFQYIVFIFVFASLLGGVVAAMFTLYIRNERASLLLVQAFGHAGTFAIPALLFAYLVHPRPAQYLGLRTPGRQVHWLAVVLLMLGAIPLILALGGLMREVFDFGPAADKLHEQTEIAMKKMMGNSSAGQLTISLLVMALLPAVGEELMFRGIVMRFTARRAKTMVFPVAVSALMFALAHFTNPYALFPIFLSGVLLALIYYWTGSLLCSMMAHFLFNGTQIFLYSLARHSDAVKVAIESESLPAVWIAAGAVIFAAGGWLLWRTRTPLPHPAWAQDFSPEELAEREAEGERRARM